jgi:hypothetical protein
MKTSFLLWLTVLSVWLAPNVGISDGISKQQLSKDGYSGPFDKWITRGQIFADSGSNGKTPYCDYFYTDVAGQTICLQGNLENVNSMFKIELTNARITDDFMHKGLSGLLFATMSPLGWHLINEQWLKVYPQIDKKQYLKLKSYMSDAEPIVKNNQWTLSINVMTDWGGAEHWVFSGTTNPVHVASFNRTIVEPEDKFTYGVQSE